MKKSSRDFLERSSALNENSKSRDILEYIIFLERSIDEMDDNCGDRDFIIDKAEDVRRRSAGGVNQ